MSSTAYDIAIIGGGMGGYAAAIRAAQRGASVVLVERDRVGGTCLNYGCIPTKAMLRDAELYRDAASGQYALQADAFSFDYQRMLERKKAVVDSLVGGVEHLLANYGIRIMRGSGFIPALGRLSVRSAEGEETLAARNIIIASGAQPVALRVPGADLPGVLDTSGILAYPRQPRSIVIIGASVSGMEFACLYQALGARVVVLDREFFMMGAEQQLAKRLQAQLRQTGMQISIGVEVERIEQSPEGLHVTYHQGAQALNVEGEVVLVAIGRAPYSAGLGLEALGAAYKGHALAVDAYMRTNLKGIYAIGDCIGGLMLAHVAAYEGEVAVGNILGGGLAADYSVVPSCIFTMPEIAGVGLTEAEAKMRGIAVSVSRFPFSASGRALTIGEAEGQVRLVCERTADGRGGRVLGAHIMGPHASDLIAEAALAMRLGASAADIAGTIHAHPTLSEALSEAAMAQGAGALHFAQR
ncbi:MAG: dihydrolipoyl dehydrogenase [Chloroflexi bacterium]|nr:dihydrolipoyl dehydrogenase [Chloroflexota bacterium]